MTGERKSRIAVLRERVKAAAEAKEATYDAPFRGAIVALRKIRVRTDFPLYRIQSGRTRRAQTQYLDEHLELPSEFFSDAEDPKVQDAQHRILMRMIGEMELDKDLVEKGQRAPLILTFDGSVVDGNRRLAALREEKAEYVDAVVLPEDAENQDIYETELELQMQRETKAKYNWIDQALHLEYGVSKLGEDPAILATRTRLSVDKIDKELQKLKLVRLYLDWLGTPGKYHKIPSDGTSMEQAFEDIAQRLESAAMLRRSEAERRMIRQVCFAAIKGVAGYKDIRSLIRQLSTDPQKFLDRLKEKEPALATARADAPRPQSPPDTSQLATDDPLLDIVDEAAQVSAPAVDELLTIVSDPTMTEKAGPMLVAIVEELEAEAKDAKQSQAPMKLLQRALGDLRKVDLGADTENLTAIAKLLGDLSYFPHFTDAISRQGRGRSRGARAAPSAAPGA